MPRVMRTGVLLLFSVSLHSIPAQPLCARQVSVENGNIFVTGEGGQTRQITSSGLDSEPALSADGSLLAFVREIKVPKPVLYGAPEERSAIWLASCADGWRPHLILKGPVSSQASRQASALANFRAPQFSPDKARIYFLSPEYSVTANGLFYVNRSNGAVHFFAPALRYWVVPKGDYAGDLVLDQNPLTYVAGRIEIYYLFGPNGKQLGIVGLTEANVNFFLDEFAK
jgi:dipeptidyl aminopeptidase/acylaminoacyl peptidase